MPSTVAEGIVGMPLSWVVLVGNGAIAVLLAALIPVAIRDDASPVQLLVYLSVIFAWIAITWYSALLLVVRPRHSADSLRAANSGTHTEVMIPGSARSAAGATLAATALALAAFMGCFVADGGWVFVLAAIAAGCAAAAIDQGIGARQRRYLFITPDAVEAGSFSGAARIDWDDVASISVRQGFGGHLVFRVAARERASSWIHVIRHPLHRFRPWMDIEPSALNLDPVLLGVNLFAAWEDKAARASIDQATTIPRLVTPDWSLESSSSPGAASLLREFRPERRTG